MKNIALIDNHDSFTYNIKHLIEQTGCAVDVFDSLSLDINFLVNYEKLIIGPGPGLPSDYPNITSLLERYAQTKSILGICLGHQAIAQYFGAQSYNLKEVFHGITSILSVDNRNVLFRGLPSKIPVGRYHSWAVSSETFPYSLKITAQTDDNVIMGLQHTFYNICGIQFHPESILTPHGEKMMFNWIFSSL
ncbi:MAG: anthranilate synthase component II [Prevotella sp.]